MKPTIYVAILWCEQHREAQHLYCEPATNYEPQVVGSIHNSIEALIIVTFVLSILGATSSFDAW